MSVLHHTSIWTIETCPNHAHARAPGMPPVCSSHTDATAALCVINQCRLCVCATATCRQPAFQVFRRDSWFRPHQYFPPTAPLAPTFLASCPISNLRRAGVFSVSQSVRQSVRLLSLSLSLFLSLSLASSLSHTRTHPLSKRLLHQRPSFMPEPLRFRHLLAYAVKA